MEDGKRIREDADGQKYVLVVDENGDLSEYPVK